MRIRGKISKFAALLIFFTACEEVIDIELKSAAPTLAVEASISRDSVCIARLTTTTAYFETAQPGIIDNAEVSVSDGNQTEILSYTGNGLYKGSSLTGIENTGYELLIRYEGREYRASSFMPEKTNISNSGYSKSNQQSILNPDGETVFTVSCSFPDNPLEDNYYMITYTEDGSLIERRFFMLTEKNNNGGTMEYGLDNTIRFAESIFYEGGEIELKLYSIDEAIYNYFFQLDDILFWKRRYLPPVPYNPLSNFSNGALGYFAAWNIDSVTMTLE
ncbi:MAG: DUF4249 family protein [Marinilabiliaceae bacterium]|jgi:hypothetical protein|nr:DUF4249 family protein [Marinilabiliaceae bacterium]